VFDWFSDHHGPDLEDAPHPFGAAGAAPTGKSFQL
jgi:hypothetical protein